MVRDLSSCICIILLLSAFVGYGQGSSTLNYGVAITTIPPRYGVLHFQLRSWLSQSITAESIRIFVPKAYKRFRSKRLKKGSGTYRDQLVSQLHQHSDLSKALRSGLIEVVDIEQDWGPLTKFAGTVQFINRNSEAIAVPHVDYWIFCDDDVSYSSSLAAHYAAYINAFREHTISSHTSHNVETYNIGFTMFASEQRLQLHLGQEVRNVPHIQGVDSYIIPAAAFSINLLPPLQTLMPVPGSSHLVPDLSSIISPLRNATNILRIISRLHNEWCPDSFYQDDYIVSALLSLSGVYMHSARLASPLCSTSYSDDINNGAGQDDYCISGTKECGFDCTQGISLTSSIDGVSKQNYQMHMKEEVFMREEITQHCLTMYASDIYEMLYNQR